MEGLGVALHARTGSSNTRFAPVRAQRLGTSGMRRLEDAFPQDDPQNGLMHMAAAWWAGALDFALTGVTNA